jgi:glycosyltransferase EpsE
MLQAWAQRESRIKVLANSPNQGLAITLDRCIERARGELLIRQDADDTSLPGRFDKLVSAMDAHPEMTVIGSWMACFDEKGDTGFIRPKELPHSADFVHGTVFCHPTCIMRRSAIVSLGGYGNEPWAWRNEDYYLWFKLYAAGLRGMNLQESLYRYRDDMAAFSRRGWSSRWREAKVRWIGFGMINLPWWRRLTTLTPLLKCLVPYAVYTVIRKHRLGGN